MDKINIVCATDSNYIPHFAALLQSLKDHNPRLSFTCHVLHDSVEKNLQLSLEKHFNNVQFCWYEVDNHVVLDFKPLLQISRATYLRLMMLEVLDNSITRVLYLDVDMIVNANIEQLWRIDLEDKLCGVVVDPGVDAEQFAEANGLVKGPSYFNAGVMVMNLTEIRKADYMKKCIDLLSEPEADYLYADQDVLNISLWGECRFLDIHWNFQRKFLYNDYQSYLPDKKIKPSIIHYTEQEKPWKASEWHPYAWLYIKALSKTPFYKELCKKEGLTLKHLAKRRLKYHFYE